MDLYDTTVILWTTFGLFILLIISIICGLASSIFINSNKRVHKETRMIEDSSFGTTIVKSTPEV